MLQRIRESLALILTGLLPLHAFLVTFGTKLIQGPGHSPMGVLALWKELLLLVILAIAFFEIVKKSYELRVTRNIFRPDLLDGIIVILCFIALLLVTRNPKPETFALGFKYDFLPLCAFLVLRRADWSEQFKKRVVTFLLVLGCLVSAVGILLLVLPSSVLQALGYSDLHSLYVPGGPLAPFQQLGSTTIRRMQSVMSGPNQLGLWMLLPWSAALTMLPRLKEQDRRRSWVYGALLLSSLAIALSYSRAAWIAAALIAIVAVWKSVPRKIFVTFVAIFGSLGGIAMLTLFILFPQILLRATSNAEHIERPLEAIRVMVQHPLGLGLGAAGPATNRLSDSCQDFPAGSDVSWATAHPELCIFVGGTQVQPIDHECHCPVLPENWFLQIGIELGWLGMILWTVLTALVLVRTASPLAKASVDRRNPQPAINSIVFLSLIGISIVGLFLHAWEDAAVALTFWILSAIALQKRNKLV